MAGTYDPVRMTGFSHPGNQQLQQAFKKLKTKGIISMCSYAAAIPLAYVNTAISGLLFFLVAIIWHIPERKIEEAIKEE